jgi:hypothetical protein
VTFVLFRYKADQESGTFATNKMNPEWIEKGQRVTEQYLKDLSTKLGRNVTLDELRARENEKQKRINDEAEQAKIKRLNRIHAPEHSYHSRPGKIALLGSKTGTVKLEGEEIVDPTTLILQVAAQNADNFVDIVNDEDLSSSPHIVEVDLLSGTLHNHIHMEAESYVQITGRCGDSLLLQELQFERYT